MAGNEMMQNSVLQLDPRDNVVVALAALPKSAQIAVSGNDYTLVSDIPAKQKFATEDLQISRRQDGLLAGQ
jgi:altronate hydrolase